MILIGPGSPVQTFHISAAALREVDLVGMFRYGNAYPAAIAYIQRARSHLELRDVSKLITHRFEGLERVEAAFAMAAKGQADDGHFVLVMVPLGDAT